MTIKEIHIDVRDQLQRLSANRNRKVNADQIDLYLNKIQQSMISSAVEPVNGSGHYQINEKKYDSISSLVISRRQLAATWVTNRYISMLPPDFWYLLDDASGVQQVCKGESKITNYGSINITRVQFPYSTLTSNCYSNVEILYNNSSIFNISTLALQKQRQWVGLPSTEGHFYIKDLILDHLINLGISVYWEEFYNVSYPFHLIFVSDTPAVPITVKLDGQEYTGITQVLSTEFHSTTRSSILSPNTMVSPDRLMSTGATPYFKTVYFSPTSEKGPNVIYTYVDESFIVYNTTINYVRKPRSMSLSLGTECQLSPSIHQQLCDETVQLILNRLAASEWKETTEQNTIMNQ